IIFTNNLYMMECRCMKLEAAWNSYWIMRSRLTRSFPPAGGVVGVSPQDIYKYTKAFSRKH
ncbi:MAG: hypothetical protein ABI203_10215, partial [Mucilaginibacter sp.]